MPGKYPELWSSDSTDQWRQEGHWYAWIKVPKEVREDADAEEGCLEERVASKEQLLGRLAVASKYFDWHFEVERYAPCAVGSPLLCERWLPMVQC